MPILEYLQQNWNPASYQAKELTIWLNFLIMWL